MLTGVKDFVINRVLRQIADNAKLNAWTNWIAVALTAAIAAKANWVVIIAYFSHPTPAGLEEVLRVSGVMVGAVLLFLTGKFPGLKAWLPVAEDIIVEAEKEAVTKP